MTELMQCTLCDVFIIKYIKMHTNFLIISIYINECEPEMKNIITYEARRLHMKNVDYIHSNIYLIFITYIVIFMMSYIF